MPPFQSNPNAPVADVQPTLVYFFFGSQARNVPVTKMQVTSIAKTGGTATVGVQVVEGNIPAQGSLVTITGVTADTSFNVTNVALSAVTINATTGAGTIQFALSGTLVSTNSAGQALVPPPLVGETISQGEFSQSFALVADAGCDLTWDAVFTGTAFSTIQLDLQGSLDSAFTNPGQLDTFNVVGNTMRHVTNKQIPFVRVAVVALTGGDGTSLAVVRLYVKYRGASS